MSTRIRHFRVALCVTLMVAAILAVAIWWPIPWLVFALLVIGLACLAAMFYMWMMARRIDRLMGMESSDLARADKVHSGHGAGAEPEDGHAR